MNVMEMGEFKKILMMGAAFIPVCFVMGWERFCVDKHGRRENEERN